MPQKNCENCASPFRFPAYREKTARFCSSRCRALHVAAQPNSCCAKGPRPHLIGNKFRLGKTPTPPANGYKEPWNKGLKGIHLSPESEFKKGSRSAKTVAVGTERTRRTKGGHLRVFIKVAEPNRWRLRAVVEWERANGQPVPRGKLIHHKDRNSLNDDIGNLACLTRQEHVAEHASEIYAGRWPLHAPPLLAQKSGL